MKFAIGLIFCCSFFVATQKSIAFTNTNSPARALAGANTSAPVDVPPKESKMSTGDLAAWATAIAAIANLFLVLIFFICGNRQHKTEQKARIAGFWIEELIMRQHHGMIHKFFDDYEERLKQPTQAAGSITHSEMQQKASADIITFKFQLRKIEHQVIEPLQWIYRDCDELLQVRNEIEDLVTTEMSKLPGMAVIDIGNGSKDPVYRLSELRRRFFQTIHKYQTDVLVGSNSNFVKWIRRFFTKKR